MTIGITLVIIQQIMPVGLHQKVLSLSTTHVLQDGVFLMVEAMVSGQRRWVQVKVLLKAHYTTAPTQA